MLFRQYIILKQKFPETLNACNLFMRCNFRRNGRRIYDGSTVMTMIQRERGHVGWRRGSGSRCCVTSLSDVNGFEVMTIEPTSSFLSLLPLLTPVLGFPERSTPCPVPSPRARNPHWLPSSRQILNFHKFLSTGSMAGDWLIRRSEIIVQSAN